MGIKKRLLAGWMGGVYIRLYSYILFFWLLLLLLSLLLFAAWRLAMYTHHIHTYIFSNRKQLVLVQGVQVSLSTRCEKRTERPRMKTLLPFFSLSSEGLGLLIPLRIMWRLWVYRHPSKRHSHVSIAPIYIYIRLSRWQKTPIITTTTVEAEKKSRKIKKQQRGADVLTRYCWESWRAWQRFAVDQNCCRLSIYSILFFFLFFCGLRISPYISHSILLAGAILFFLLLWNCSLVTAYRVLWCVSVFLNSSSPSLLLRIVRVFLCLFYFLRFYSRGKSETAHHQRH